MKKLFKIAQAQLWSVVFPAKNDLKKIENDLNSLQKEMLEISKMNNKVEAIHFLSLLSSESHAVGSQKHIFKKTELLKSFSRL